MTEYVDVEYHVVISVLETEPAPTTEDLKKAIYRGSDWIDTEDAILVTAEGGAL